MFMVPAKIGEADAHTDCKREIAVSQLPALTRRQVFQKRTCDVAVCELPLQAKIIELGLEFDDDGAVGARNSRRNNWCDCNAAYAQSLSICDVGPFGPFQPGSELEYEQPRLGNHGCERGCTRKREEDRVKSGEARHPRLAALLFNLHEEQSIACEVAYTCPTRHTLPTGKRHIPHTCKVPHFQHNVRCDRHFVRQKGEQKIHRALAILVEQVAA